MFRVFSSRQDQRFRRRLSVFFAFWLVEVLPVVSIACPCVDYIHTTPDCFGGHGFSQGSKHELKVSVLITFHLFGQVLCPLVLGSQCDLM